MHVYAGIQTPDLQACVWKIVWKTKIKIIFYIEIYTFQDPLLIYSISVALTLEDLESQSLY
jgi:hypothetical protein